MKMNALVDPELIDAFYDAAQKGAEIDLFIRGICCLRPGVAGFSERIRVRSIIGRFLEHFAHLPLRRGSTRPAEYLIGSADLMPRNLDRRIEALLTITDPELQARLDEILELGMADDVGAWELLADGTWRTVQTGHGIELQRRLQELALAGEPAGAPAAERASSAGERARTDRGRRDAEHERRRGRRPVIRDALDGVGAAPARRRPDRAHRRRPRRRTPGARGDPPFALRPAHVRAAARPALDGVAAR